MADSVTVHAFEVWDWLRQQWVRRPLKRPAKSIDAIREATRIIPGTEQKVDASQLDNEGCYHPSNGR